MRRRILVLLATIAAAATVLAALAAGHLSERAPRRAEGTVAPPPSVGMATLEVDGLATVNTPGGLRIWAEPENPEAEPLLGDLPSGTTVYLTRGPEVVDGQAWWEMQPGYGPAIRPPFGWIRATDDAGGPNLVPLSPICPASDQVMTAGALRAMGGIAALACFGDASLSLEGTLTCMRSARDGGAGGPSWLAPHSSCSMDEALAINGQPVEVLLEGGLQPPNPRTGRYRVQGHFDDAEARTCSWVPVGVSVTSPVGPPDPGAVIVCRLMFVATGVEPLPDP